MNVGATKKIRPDQLTGTLAESLLEWERENEERFFRAIDDAADACNETAGQYLTPGHGYKTFCNRTAADRATQLQYHMACGSTTLQADTFTGKWTLDTRRNKANKSRKAYQIRATDRRTGA